MTKEAEGVSWHQVVHARGNETIEVPIGADDIGDTWVNVAFLKDDRLYRAERRVKVPPSAGNWRSPSRPIRTCPGRAHRAAS